MFLSALDMYYLPRIVLRASHSDRWQKENEAFDLQDRLAMFATVPETIAAVAEGLLAQAHFLDPLGSWYELIRHAHPDEDVSIFVEIGDGPSRYATSSFSHEGVTGRGPPVVATSRSR